MKQTKLIAVMVGIVAIIVAVLLYNRSQMAARSKSDVVTSVPVTVTAVSHERISSPQSLVGTITANNDVSIIAETQGRVTGVHAEVGHYAPAGSTLVQVDDELKKASFAAAEVNYEKAKRDLERFESLAKQDAATDQQLETARLAFKAAESQYILSRREYRDTKITTPISGIVSARPVDVGTYIQKGMPVANVVDISKLKVRMNAAERDVFRLKTGDAAEITTDVYPGVTFKGKVQTISSKADDAHTYPVEVSLNNPKDHPLKSGMFCRVNFPSIVESEGLTIPREAVVGSLKQPQVFVVEGSNVRLRNIVVGSEIGTRLVILQGLKRDESVVINGQSNLKDGVQVTIVK